MKIKKRKMKIVKIKKYENLKKTKNEKIKGCGIDLLDLMKEDLVSPNRLVNVKNIDELKFIKFEILITQIRNKFKAQIFQV